MKKIISILLVFSVLSFSVFAEDISLTTDSSYDISNDSRFAIAIPALGVFAKFLLDTVLVCGAVAYVGDTYFSKDNVFSQIDYDVKSTIIPNVVTKEDLVACGVPSVTANKINSIYERYKNEVKTSTTPFVITKSDVKGIDFKKTAKALNYKTYEKIKGDISLKDNVSFVRPSERSIVEGWISRNMYYAFYSTGTSTDYPGTIQLAFWSRLDSVDNGKITMNSTLNGRYGYFTFRYATSGFFVNDNNESTHYDNVWDFNKFRLYSTNIDALSPYIIPKSDSMYSTLDKCYPLTLGDDILQEKEKDIPIAFPNTMTITNDDVLSIGNHVGGISDTEEKVGVGLGTGSIVLDGDITTVVGGTDTGEGEDTGLISGLINKVISSINDIVDSITDFFGWFTKPITKSIDFTPLYIDVKNKFPFSLPWDFANAFSSFVAKRETPKFEIKFDEGLVGSASFTIDFSPFERIAEILRYFILIGFIVGLVVKTRDLIGG